MSNPIFYTPIDNASTTLASAHSSGDGVLAVVNASSFGSPSTSNPIRITVVRKSDNARCHYKVTSITGNNISINSVIDGYSDISLAIGDTVSLNYTAGTISDIQNAILRLYNGTISNPHVYTASAITGCVLDCDINTGQKIGGGTPTDNSTVLNAVLSTATATNPIYLIIDGGSALSAPLVIPASGHVTIIGLGWDTGFYMSSGSNSNCIQNFARSDLNTLGVWQPSAATPINGKNVWLANFRISGNRGTYPNGNCNGTRDGTITNSTILSSTPDARGPYPNSYWLSGIILTGMANVLIEHIYVYDAPAYHINLYACAHVRIKDCRIEAANSSESNQDGIHINSGCYDIIVDGCRIKSGDDAVAINLDEGESAFVTDPLANSDIVVSNLVLDNCISVGRVHGSSSTSRRVRFSGVSGTVQWWGVLIGNNSTTSSEINHSILLDDFDINVTSPVGSFQGAHVAVTSSCALLELNKIRVNEPYQNTPLVWAGSSSAKPTISTLRIVDCGVNRNSTGHSDAPLFVGDWGNIGKLIIKDCYLTEQYGQSNSDVGAFIDTGHLNITYMSLSGSYKSAYTLLNVPNTSTLNQLVINNLDHTANNSTNAAYTIVAAGSIVSVSIGQYTGVNLAGIASGTVSLSGPGLLSKGVTVADSLVSYGTVYYSSTNNGLYYKNNNGTLYPFTLGAGVAPIHATRSVLMNKAANSNLSSPLTHASATAFQVGSGSFSVGCFVKMTTKIANLQGYMSKWNNGTPANSEWMLFYANGPDAFAFITSNTTATTEADGTTHPSAGTWYFVVGVYDRTGATNTLYVNAVSEKVVASAIIPQNNTTAFQIGTPVSDTGWLSDASIAMAFKYSFALSSAQVTYLYNSGSGRSTAEILAQTGLTTPDFLYGFDNGIALGLDSSANNLTLNSLYSTPPSQSTGPG